MSNPSLKRVVDGAGAGTAPQQTYQGWSGPGQGAAYGQAGYPQQGFPQQGYPQAPGYPQGYPGGPGQGPVRSASNYLDMNDIVTKTAISLVTVIVSAVATWLAFAPPAGSSGSEYNTITGVTIGAGLIGLVLGLVNSFKREPNPALILAYCVAEGAFLGGISGVFERFYPGIVIQAVVATMGVFIGMLVVYRTGAIRVTPKFQRYLGAALIGAFVLMLFNMVWYLATGEASILRDGGGMAIGFSLLMIGIAAFTLLADFDMADQAIRRGAPKKFAWAISFGLIAGLVWLYLEILRLLSYFRE